MTDETLAAKASDLDTLVTDIEGAASALAGLNSEEVPHECGHGRAWLAGEIHGLVAQLRELTDDLFEAAHGPRPPAKKPISRQERLHQIFNATHVMARQGLGPEDLPADTGPTRDPDGDNAA